MVGRRGGAACVGLERVNSGNRAAVEALRVAETQRAYLTTPSLAEFLADDQLHPTFTSYAVSSEGLVVGLVSAGYKPDAPGEAWIPLIVIDRKHQGRGLGRAAMVAVINLLSADPRGFSGVGLSCQPANEVAMRLYDSLGFAPTGTLEANGEVVLRRRLADS